MEVTEADLCAQVSGQPRYLSRERVGEHGHPQIGRWTLVLLSPGHGVPHRGGIFVDMVHMVLDPIHVWKLEYIALLQSFRNSG